MGDRKKVLATIKIKKLNTEKYPDIFNPNKVLTKVSKNKSALRVDFECRECGHDLIDGSYSVKNGRYCCNYPCFIKIISMLQGPKLSANDLKLKDLYASLELYNSYFIDNVSRQISVIDDGITIFMESIINIYWNYSDSIILDGLAKDLKKIINLNIKPKYINFNKTSTANVPVIFEPGKQKEYGTMINIPANHCTNVRLTSNDDTQTVIRSLFSKYSILNDPSMFSLYCLSGQRGRIQLYPTDIPLFLCLKNGPSDNDCKICITNFKDDKVSSESYQYVGLPVNMLHAFIFNIEKQESDYINKIEKTYNDYNEALINIINSLRKLGEQLDDSAQTSF